MNKSIVESSCVKGNPIPDVFEKIPIVISKYSDGKWIGWKVEISDKYENYVRTKYSHVNFEDLSFHFNHPFPTHGILGLDFQYKKDALACARYCNKLYLKGKAKIWVLK